ncbi:hypothetical protein OCU04_012765 [Sclerotinia nivalis]|uniref:Uncharacterized protein n=1 Tax=Sclerotinia nivalis TaxID=352851 RepID=A0A9X0A986_9HELO|nr:hypothetical protein OCU04_012765 [Sclerotinia nivalis]
MSLSPSNKTFMNSVPADSNLKVLKRCYELQTIACLHASCVDEGKLDLLNYWKPICSESLVDLFIKRSNQPRVVRLPLEMASPEWNQFGSKNMAKQKLVDLFHESINLEYTLTNFFDKLSTGHDFLIWSCHPWATIAMQVINKPSMKSILL